MPHINKKWSDKHNLNSCKMCGTSERPHRAQGYCNNCHQKVNRDRYKIHRINYQHSEKGKLAKEREKEKRRKQSSYNRLKTSLEMLQSMNLNEIVDPELLDMLNVEWFKAKKAAKEAKLI